jgi:hypothetical protein
MVLYGDLWMTMMSIRGQMQTMNLREDGLAGNA